jgi:hypothetical protein
MKGEGKSNILISFLIFLCFECQNDNKWQKNL